MNATVLNLGSQVETESLQKASPHYTHLTNIVRPAPRVYDTQTCKETLRVLFSYPESKCIVVCDKSDHPVGLVMYNRFYLQMTRKSGIGGIYTERITKSMNRTPLIVDMHCTIDSLQEEINKQHKGHQSDCIIVTENAKLIGIVNVSDLDLLTKPLI